jgi:hypothetical protein
LSSEIVKRVNGRLPVRINGSTAQPFNDLTIQQDALFELLSDVGASPHPALAGQGLTALGRALAGKEATLAGTLGVTLTMILHILTPHSIQTSPTIAF